MENATKALSIAAGIIIAMLIVGLIVYGWTKITSYQKVQEQTTKTEQITNFNKEFESYNKSVIRGYQLLSLANLVNDTNYKYSSTNGYSEIKVYVMLCKEGEAVGTYNNGAYLPGATGDARNKYKTTYFNMLNYAKQFDNINADNKKEFKELYFDCQKVEYDNNNGRVKEFYYQQIFKTN